MDPIEYKHPKVIGASDPPKITSALSLMMTAAKYLVHVHVSINKREISRLKKCHRKYNIVSWFIYFPTLSAVLVIYNLPMSDSDFPETTAISVEQAIL